ncbi:MAG: PfkB family carbohydrate kinase [Chloroflexota bacterium]
MARSRVDVVHIGSACRDVAPDDPRGWRMGGGVTYASLTTARLGLRTAAIVGVDETARHAIELDMLRDAGVAIQLVPLPEGPVFHNLETPAGRVQLSVQTGVPLPVVEIPQAWRSAPGWSVVPVAGEVTDDWAVVVPPDAHLAVAWQGFLRELAAGKQVTRRPPRPSAILERADLVGVSHHDVPPETPLEDLYALLHPGAVLLVTRGAEGGLLVQLGPDGPIEVLRYLPTATRGELDPTGAGDTFLAALQASVLRPGVGGRRRARHGLDLRFAAAAGSLVVEGPGLEGVPDRPAVLVRRARERIRRAVLPSEVTQVGAVDGT